MGSEMCIRDRGNEETTALMELTDSSRIMANAYLCGHTHNRTVVNWNNNVRTLNTFMTGIGQGDAENDRVNIQEKDFMRFMYLILS